MPSAGKTAKGHKLSVVDTAGLTDADWAAVNRVNRAYEAGGIERSGDELDKLDDVAQAVTVASFSGFDPRK